MKIKCQVCGKRFMPDKEKIYLVTNKSGGMMGSLTPTLVSDATDCPRCGCQRILFVRMPSLND